MGAKGKFQWIFLAAGVWMTSCQTPPEPTPEVDTVPEIAPTAPVVEKAVMLA